MFKVLATLVALGAVAVSSAATAQPASLLLTDQRPAEENVTKFMSLMITSCDYSIRRIGDKGQKPDRIARLKADLEAAFGDRLAGHSLSVTHYTAHFNSAAYWRGITYGRAGGGVVADMMSTMGSKCPREKTKAGWYEASELTAAHSPIIVELSVNLDGKAYAVRTVYSPDRELTGAFADPKEAVVVAAALSAADQALIGKLKEAGLG